MFKTMKASDASGEAHKTLLYAHHGFGKTYQFRHYQRVYGKGLIISGESGLRSIEDTDVEYLPFSSWDGEHDPDKGVYSFVGIAKMLQSQEFKDAGYKWIGIDSATEMSERCLQHFQKKHEGSKDGFAVWGDYERAMIGYLKWVRDLPYHVLVTCLAAEETDDNDATHYWPMVKQKKVAKQLPALFDHVFCGIRKTVPDPRDPTGAAVRVGRFFVTDEVNGWHGKTRDPRQRLKPVEKCSDITELHTRMALPDDAYDTYLKARETITKKEETEQ
jgi:hypothetical protein